MIFEVNPTSGKGRGKFHEGNFKELWSTIRLGREPDEFVVGPSFNLGNLDDDYIYAYVGKRTQGCDVNQLVRIEAYDLIDRKMRYCTEDMDNWSEWKEW